MTKAKLKTDNKTLELIKEINRQKEEINKAEKPNWQTHCSFSYSENPSGAINLHVESNIRNLICMASFVLDKEKSYNETANNLNLADYPKFTWSGFTAQEWFNDIKLRINKIQILSKKKKLELLEARLNAIISPELRAEMEIQAIENELL